MFNESLNGKIASTRRQNDRLKTRHREIELDEKYAMNSENAIRPSQIRVTITGRQNSGLSRNTELDSYTPKAKYFTNTYGRRPSGNGFSKSMSRLPQDAQQCKIFDQNQYCPAKYDRNNNNHYKNKYPLPYKSHGSHHYYNRDEFCQRRNNATPRYVEFEAPYVYDQPDVDRQRQKRSNLFYRKKDLVIENTSKTYFLQRENASRGQRPQRGVYENPANHEYGHISSAKSMSSLDFLSPNKEIKNGGNISTVQHVNFALEGDNRNYTAPYSAKRFYNNPRKHGTSFCSQNPEKWRCNDYTYNPSDSMKSAQTLKCEKCCQVSNTSTKTSAWPLQPVPVDRKGLWVRGMILREKDVNNSLSIKVEATQSDLKSKENPAEPSSLRFPCFSKATSPHRPAQNENSNLSEEFVEFDDEYIDDNPLDDLDQFTLKIDMDGGFVVRDASIRDPILLKPICAWLDDEFADLNLETEKGGSVGNADIENEIMFKKIKIRSSSYPRYTEKSKRSKSNIGTSSFRIEYSEENNFRPAATLRLVASANCLCAESVCTAPLCGNLKTIG